MPELVLIRGLPGSGKSTMAKMLANTHVHVEADQFFMKGGVYVFDRNKLPLVHQRCQNRVKDMLAQGHNVVVSNTFTTKREMQFYFDLATQMGYPIKVITASGNYNNVHNVPKEKIDQMRARWEEL